MFTRFLIWINTAAILSILAGCPNPQSGDGNTIPGEQVAVELEQASGQIDLSDIKPLDVPANPYSDEYREWDTWLKENAEYVSVGKDFDYWRHTSGQRSDVINSVIDNDGYMLPLLRFQELREASIRNAKFDEFKKSYHWVYSSGTIPPDLKESLRKAQLGIRARFHQPIPAWLVETPPPSAMLLPNGMVVIKRDFDMGGVMTGMPAVKGGTETEGKKEKDAENSEDGVKCCGGLTLNEGAFLLDKDGEPIGYQKGHWWKLFYDPEVNGWPEGAFEMRYDGYAIFRDARTRRLLGVYDYDGTDLESREDPPVRDSHDFTFLTADELQIMYEAQQEAKR